MSYPKTPRAVLAATPPARVPHVAVLECDIAQGLRPIDAVDVGGAPWSSVELLVRIFTEPIGVVRLPVGPAGLGVDEIALAITVKLGSVVAERLRAAGVPWPDRIPLDGVTPAIVPPFEASRARVLAAAPPMTVAICTRDRPEGLSALLDSLADQVHPRMSVLVVDNAPSNDAARQVVRRHAKHLDINYVIEPRPGLSWARNLAIAASTTEIIGWLDDDEHCDPWWAAEIARGFVEHPGADAVSGMTLPAEIETPAQANFERYGGHSKGRGFEPDVFSPATRDRQHPLYPLPPFGTGCNMAFRRDALERIGGFDTALGAGTLTRAAEDTAALSTLLLKGGTIVYQPTAITRHWHRRDDAALHSLMEAYGSGLSAFYASMVLRDPRVVPQLLGLAPRALHDLLASDGARLEDLDADFPPELLRAHRRGLLRGPGRYLRARRAATRLAREGTA
jgi:glycosyltransferase involved in cell wall biosynthesis